MNFIPSKTIIKPNKIINKRRALSQILIESEKAENQQILKLKLTKILDKNENNKKQIKEPKENSSDNIDIKKVSNKNISSTKYNIGIKNYKITINSNISKRYLVFKKINEYLESNNITLFELLKHNPF